MGALSFPDAKHTPTTEDSSWSIENGEQMVEAASLEDVAAGALEGLTSAAESAAAAAERAVAEAAVAGPRTPRRTRR